MYMDWIVYFQFILNVWIYFFQSKSIVKNIVFHCFSIWIICVIRFFDLAKMVRDSLFKSIKMFGFWRFLLLNPSVKICQNLSKLPTMEYICQIRYFIHLPGDNFSQLKIYRRYDIKIQCDIRFDWLFNDGWYRSEAHSLYQPYRITCIAFPLYRRLDFCSFVTL